MKRTKKKFFVMIVAAVAAFTMADKLEANDLVSGVKSNILLQVEQHGEAWYVWPGDGRRYYLGRPQDAFAVMSRLSLGARHDFIAQTEIFPERLAGIILLDAERNGEAYYISPGDRRKYYLARPADAFALMRQLGLGVTDADLKKIPVGVIGQNDPAPADPAPDTARSIDHAVPFTAQAPLAEWSDPRQQDGCEEAASLMAVSWARGETFTKDEARRIILDASAYELEKYGEYRDVSAADTVTRIFNDYFKFDRVSLVKNITAENIKKELFAGYIVVTPMNGQALGNPNFTPPGPERHMLVIRGYDAATDEFITNDPGTRKGEGYRYPVSTLFSAIRDYPTGHHEPIEKTEKVMIVVSK